MGSSYSKAFRNNNNLEWEEITKRLPSGNAQNLGRITVSFPIAKEIIVIMGGAQYLSPPDTYTLTGYVGDIPEIINWTDGYGMPWTWWRAENVKSGTLNAKVFLIKAIT